MSIFFQLRFVYFQANAQIGEEIVASGLELDLATERVAMKEQFKRAFNLILKPELVDKSILPLLDKVKDPKELVKVEDMMWKVRAYAEKLMQATSFSEQDKDAMLGFVLEEKNVQDIDAHTKTLEAMIEIENRYQSKLRDCEAFDKAYKTDILKNYNARLKVSDITKVDRRQILCEEFEKALLSKFGDDIAIKLGVSEKATKGYYTDLMVRFKKLLASDLIDLDNRYKSLTQAKEYLMKSEYLKDLDKYLVPKLKEIFKDEEIQEDFMESFEKADPETKAAMYKDLIINGGKYLEREAKFHTELYSHKNVPAVLEEYNIAFEEHKMKKGRIEILDSVVKKYQEFLKNYKEALKKSGVKEAEQKTLIDEFNRLKNFEEMEEKIALQKNPKKKDDKNEGLKHASSIQKTKLEEDRDNPSRLKVVNKEEKLKENIEADLDKEVDSFYQTEEGKRIFLVMDSLIKSRDRQVKCNKVQMKDCIARTLEISNHDPLLKELDAVLEGVSDHDQREMIINQFVASSVGSFSTETLLNQADFANLLINPFDRLHFAKRMYERDLTRYDRTRGLESVNCRTRFTMSSGIEPDLRNADTFHNLRGKILAKNADHILGKVLSKNGVSDNSEISQLYRGNCLEKMSDYCANNSFAMLRRMSGDEAGVSRVA
ncbi:MAG: hypothetical protein WC755_07545 [Candidatus Woesearchaeota archaeon]|jgi:hypothetical protein